MMKSIALITSLNFFDQLVQISGSGIRHRTTMEAVKEAGYELRIIVLDAIDQSFADGNELEVAIREAWGIEVSALFVRYVKPPLTWANYFFYPLFSTKYEREYLAANNAQLLAQLSDAMSGMDAVIAVRDFACLAAQNTRRRYPKHRMPIIYDTEDISHVRFSRMARDGSLYGSKRLLLAQQSARQSLDRELIESAESTLVCSDHDRGLLKALAPQAVVETVVNVGTPMIKQIESADGESLVFVGSLYYAPNIQACKALVNEIMPIVWQKIPNAVLHIAGGGLDVALKAAFSKDSRIKLYGYVADTDEAFGLGRIFVCPLSSGGGTRLKLIDAGLRDLPIVASKLAAEGLMLVHDKHYLEAESASETAKYCVSLLESQSLRTRLVQANKTHMEKYFSAKAAKAAVNKTISKLLS
jgi:glycosyltransferase involved in cell wall biosynthesis